MDDPRVPRLEERVRELEEHYAMLLGFLHSLIDGDDAEPLEAQHSDFLARCRARDVANPGRLRRGL